MSKNFSCVVAADEKNGIGYQGNLPWPRIPADMAFFKQLTEGTDEKRNAVIMGRKTWDSIPLKFRPLPNRINIVLSKTATMPPSEFSTKLYFCRKGFEETLDLASELNVDQTFVIGGGEIYQMAIKHIYCESVFLTRIEKEFPADVFLPDLAAKDLTLKRVLQRGEHKDIGYRMEEWS